MKSMMHEVTPLAARGDGNRASDPAEQPASVSGWGAGADLKLEFRRAPLGRVLEYLRQAAGLVIRVDHGVQVDRAVDLCHHQPVAAAEALSLLRQVLAERDCTMIQSGSLLKIIRSQDVKKHWIPLPAV
jgi:hypothetical protein